MRLEKGQKRVIPKLSSEGHFYFFGYRNRSLKGSRKNNFPPLSVDPSRLAASRPLHTKSMRSPRAVPDRCLNTQK